MRLWYDGGMAKDERRVLELDARRRITLGSLAAYDRYLVTTEEDGTITLTPAIVITAAQARHIEDFLDDPASGSARGRPAR
jgi:hypothetical protein